MQDDFHRMSFLAYQNLILYAPVGASNFLVNYKREQIQDIESRFRIKILIEASSELISPDLKIVPEDLERNEKRISEINNLWINKDIGKSQIYCTSYKNYFDFAAKFAETHIWPTTLNSKQNIFQQENERFIELSASLDFDEIKNTIKSKYIYYM